MNNTPVNPTPQFCSQCGNQLKPGARFCNRCGAKIEPRRQPIDSAPGASAPPSPTPALEVPPSPTPSFASPEPSLIPEPAPQYPEGHQITLQAVPPAAHANVMRVMQQTLGLTPAEAHAYIVSAPILMGVGMAGDTAEMLRSLLANAGAVVEVKSPPEPPKTEIPFEPVPEPARRIAVEAKTIQPMMHGSGLRTVTGLDLGRTFSYLSYSRAEGSKLVTPPEMVQLEAQPATPTVVCTANPIGNISIGSDALNDWVARPETVWAGFWDAVVNGEGAAHSIAQTFLGSFAHRITQVLGESALDASEGAATTLGYPGAWSEDLGKELMQTAIEAGFPVIRICPEPLAALAHHLQQGTIKLGSEIERSMVIDWGGSALRFSFIEHGGSLVKPRMFEHIELALGGTWFDEAIMTRLAEQLPPDLTEVDLRALGLFARSFKEQMCKSFADGKKNHSQYCVIPAGMPPTRVQMNLADFEALSAAAQDTIKEDLIGSVEGVGLKPEHINHILVVGGGGRWYFLRELIRSTLGQAPLIGAHPEEAVCRGLAVYRLDTN